MGPGKHDPEKHREAVNKYFKQDGDAIDSNSYGQFFEGSYFSERAGKELSIRSSRVFLHYMMQVTLDARAKKEEEDENNKSIETKNDRNEFEIPKFQKYDLLPAGIGVCGGQQKTDQITMNSFKHLNLFSLKESIEGEADKVGITLENQSRRIRKPDREVDNTEDVFVKYCKIEDYNDRGFWECFHWEDWRNPPNLVECYQEYIKSLEDEDKWSAF